MWTVYTIGEKSGTFLMSWSFETIQEALNWGAVLVDARKHSETFYLIRVEERKIGQRNAPGQVSGA